MIKAGFKTLMGAQLNITSILETTLLVEFATSSNTLGGSRCARCGQVHWRSASTDWSGMAGTPRANPLPAGVYLMRLHQGDQTRTRKMVKIE